MVYDYLRYVAVVGILLLLAFGVSLFPPLTSGATSVGSGVSQEEYEETVGQELAYCESNSYDVDCACFAQISGHILSQKESRVPFATYPDRTELARGQASKDC
ncbi:hypothetical protein GCM10007385_29330 [Tateyamaria omphalii]|uniref:hypothetical protein n=1 Tax=Tateyamaria omphalii TaxID=299262 RepID=UPI00167B2D62|nr:hypothetical protein [Tateyamaria omphalii]GGX58679.1 hypothetical protein GCM10007385_29330 [Tateyamaria omphalii]